MLGGGEPVADARSEVLGRIRAALADRPTPPPVPRDYDHQRPISDIVGLLVERVADYRATVHRVAADAVPATVASVLRERQAKVMVGPSDLPAPWRAEGVRWLLDGGSSAQGLTVEQLDGADGVLTGCAVAIAETGTIVLDAGTAQGRRSLTLLPDYHLCVVLADQIVGTVPEGIARLDPVRPLTFISGPSATSDIELDRVEGVHGPRTLEVIIAG
jgi:L-lactate dehydrogenase complex protein LldG